jgi:predicted CXXCH cytochrome family protein
MLISARSAGVLIAAMALSISTYGLAFDARPGVPPALSSRRCEACHDGVIASEVKLSHPIGIDYRLSELKSRGRLREISQLSGEIYLEDGRIGCLSCHKADSRFPAKLVTSNAGSALCFSCHNL